LPNREISKFEHLVFCLTQVISSDQKVSDICWSVCSMA